MTPRDFVTFVNSIAQEEGLPGELLIFGGDHLGPNSAQGKAEDALTKAATMVEAYVTAGFARFIWMRRWAAPVSRPHGMT